MGDSSFVVIGWAPLEVEERDRVGCFFGLLCRLHTPLLVACNWYGYDLFASL